MIDRSMVNAINRAGALEAQNILFSELRNELGGESPATWRALGIALNVNPVRLSQWRSSKGMRLETLIGVVIDWNADESRKKCQIILNGKELKVTFSP